MPITDSSSSSRLTISVLPRCARCGPGTSGVARAGMIGSFPSAVAQLDGGGDNLAQAAVGRAGCAHVIVEPVTVGVHQAGLSLGGRHELFLGAAHAELDADGDDLRELRCCCEQVRGHVYNVSG